MVWLPIPAEQTSDEHPLGIDMWSWGGNSIMCVLLASRRRRCGVFGVRRESGPAAKRSLASFRLRMKLRFITACLHPWRLKFGIHASHAAKHPAPAPAYGNPCPVLHYISRRRVARGAAGVRGMDAEPEAYRDVFTASAAPLAARRRRIETTVPSWNRPDGSNNQHRHEVVNGGVFQGLLVFAQGEDFFATVGWEAGG